VTLDLDRITHPLRLAKGSHEPGSGKGCAMNVISYINGDIQITEYPKCSARPLSRLVQILNDRLADPDGFLSPKNSVLVLDLGWRTVGTADVPREVVLRWLAELLADPVHGMVQHASPAAVPAIRRVAELLGRQVAGGLVSVAEWTQARKAANGGAYTYAAAAAYATDAPFVAYAEAAAYATDAYAAAAASAAAAYAAADAAAAATTTYAYTTAAADAGADAGAAAAYAAADAAAATAYSADARIAFTRWAIHRWRDLAGLGNIPDISPEAVDHALARIAKAVGA